MKPVHFRINGQDVSASHGENLLDAIRRLGISIDFSCEGGSCGACRVIVLSGLERLPPRGEQEAQTASDRSFDEKERLACQLEVTEGVDLLSPRKP